jgi:hypothetical protein
MLPSYSTIWRIIGELAEAESRCVQQLGSSLLIAGPMHIDNAQTYVRQRDQRIEDTTVTESPRL